MRHKPAGLLCEKTPQNIHLVRRFLADFPGGHFLHIVRHPAWVYRSQRRRGRPPYVARSVWLVDTAAAWAVRDHPRVHTIRYEDLVADPFVEVSQFIGRLGWDIAPGKLERHYAGNVYRAARRSLDSWTVRGYGTISNANRRALSNEDRRAFAYMQSGSVSDGYASRFALPTIDGRSLLEAFGYAADDPPMGSPSPAPTGAARRDLASLRFLFGKWRRDFRRRDARLADLPAYLRPTSLVA